MVGIGPISFGLVYLSVAKWYTLLSSIYLSISYKTARVVRLTPSWSHRGADIVELDLSHGPDFCCFFVCFQQKNDSPYTFQKILSWFKQQKNSHFFEIFLSPRWIFFQKNIQKYFKSGFLYVLDDSEMIWEKNIFSIFRTKFLDFGSFWRPHRTSNGYVLLVVVSRHVDKQLYQAIWSLRYWFGCSDGPKLRYLAKNVILRFWAIFGRGPYVQLFEFQFLTYPKPHSLL